MWLGPEKQNDNGQYKKGNEDLGSSSSNMIDKNSYSNKSSSVGTISGSSNTSCSGSHSKTCNSSSCNFDYSNSNKGIINNSIGTVTASGAGDAVVTLVLLVTKVPTEMEHLITAEVMLVTTVVTTTLVTAGAISPPGTAATTTTVTASKQQR